MPTIKTHGQRLGRDRMNEVAHKNVKIVKQQNAPKLEKDWRDKIIFNNNTNYFHYLTPKLKENSKKLKGVLYQTRWGEIFQLDEIFWNIDNLYSISNLPLPNLNEKNRNFAYGSTPEIADKNRDRMITTPKTLITIKPQVSTTKDGVKKQILSFFAIAPKINEQDYKNYKKEKVNYTYLPNIYRIDVVTIPNNDYYRIRFSAVAGGYSGADCPLLQLNKQQGSSWVEYGFRSSHTNTKVDERNKDIGSKALADIQTFEEACKYIFELAHIETCWENAPTNNIREIIESIPTHKQDLSHFDGSTVPEFFGRVWKQNEKSTEASKTDKNLDYSEK